jgi:hypothetical protein
VLFRSDNIQRYDGVYVINGELELLAWEVGIFPTLNES